MRSALVRALAANDLPGSAELLVQLAAIDVLNAGYLDHPRILRWTSPSFSPSRENTSTPGSRTRYELGEPRSSIAETIAAVLHHVALAVCDGRTSSISSPPAVASMMIRK